jgi:formylmethanofuran dehydrogenase subunit B
MTASVSPWSCPFCPLLCDGFALARAPVGGALSLPDSRCSRAAAALATFNGPGAAPHIRGHACDLEAAIHEATRLLAASRQPLFGGLGTDVAGARALYPLACATGAITDAGQGAALTEGLRALQDRGGFTTTLAEVRTRADLLVCFGGLPAERHPEFFNRIGISADDARVVVIGDSGDAFDTAQRLAALLEGRATAGANPALLALAERLRAASYSVLVYEPARLPRHAALIIETLQRVIATLNRTTRAAAFPLGGGDGAATVNQTFAWLSGLPLRSQLGPFGLEHEPQRFDAQVLLNDGAVDLLLWVSSFLPQAVPVSNGPRIVIGHPQLSTVSADVFIPVLTPGIGADGHLFRTDGVVLMPLHAARSETLPAAADVFRRITAALPMKASE